MRRLNIAAAVLLALAATACGADPAPTDETRQDTAPTGQQSESTEAGVADQSQPPESPEAMDQPAAADDLGDPVASRTAAKDGADFTLELFPITRTGETAVLNLRLTFAASNESSAFVDTLLGDGNPDIANEDDYSVDGVKLVDSTEGKLYLAASDGAGNCLCSTDLGGVNMDPGDTVTLTATYAAPPEAVSEMDVVLPSFGTVTGVPVV